MSDEIENRLVAGAQDEYDRRMTRSAAEQAEHEALAGEIVSALMQGEDTDPADFTDLLVEVAEDEDFPPAVLETLRELPEGGLAGLVRRHAERIADERAEELVSVQREEGGALTMRPTGFCDTDVQAPWQVNPHCAMCDVRFWPSKEPCTAAIMNRRDSLVCPQCGNDTFYDRIERWVPTHQWWNPLSWGAGYWEARQ